MNPITSAVVAMRRSPYQTLVAILMLSITFLVGYMFTTFLLGAQAVLNYFETQPQAIAFFKLESNPDEMNALEKTMREKSYVSEVKVVSKEKALEMYQQDNKNDPLLLELVTAEILPSSIEVSGKTAADLTQIKTDLEKGQGVDEVFLQQDVIASLGSWTKSMRLIGVGSIGLLSFTSFLIVFIIIGMKVHSKRAAIQIMRLIGATKWYVAVPFMIEGLIYGLVGSLIGWSASVVLILYLTPWLKNFLGQMPFLPVPWALWLVLLGVGTSIGMLLCGLAGATATKRLLKK